MPESPSADAMVAELRRRWSAVATDAGLADGATALGDELIARYGETHRHYHDQRHLLEVLQVVDELAAPTTASAATRFAAWFHDAVYAGRAGEDERASADLAVRALQGAGADDATAEAVGAMVAATATHLVPGEGQPVDADTALLLDADLAILAAPAARYDAYAAGVRAEHADVDDAAFREGRLRALGTLVGRDRLFHTEAARARYDALARSNLRREIDDLSSGAAGG